MLQAALRAAMPEGMPEQAARAAADALLQAWPERQELPGWPASGLRSCVATLRRITGDLLWEGGCHPVLVRAGDSLDRAGLTGPAVDHWRDLATTGGRLLGRGHPDTMLAGAAAGRRLPGGRARGRRRSRGSSGSLDSLTRKLGPDHPDVIEARRRLGHALVAALQLPAAITVLERAVPDSSRSADPGMPTRSARGTSSPPPTWPRASTPTPSPSTGARWPTGSAPRAPGIRRR